MFRMSCLHPLSAGIKRMPHHAPQGFQYLNSFIRTWWVLLNIETLTSSRWVRTHSWGYAKGTCHLEFSTSWWPRRGWQLEDRAESRNTGTNGIASHMVPKRKETWSQNFLNPARPACLCTFLCNHCAWGFHVCRVCVYECVFVCACVFGDGLSQLLLLLAIKILLSHHLKMLPIYKFLSFKYVNLKKNDLLW